MYMTIRPTDPGSSMPFAVSSEAMLRWRPTMM